MQAGLEYQEEDGKKLVIPNSSAKWRAAESKYHVNEQEILCLVLAIKQYSSYLNGKRFKVKTDSRDVTYLNKYKEEKSKFYRWSLTLHV